MSVLSNSSADAAGVITVTSDTAGEPIYASVRGTAYGAGDEQTIADGTGAIWTSGEITSELGVNTFQTAGVSGDQFYGVVQGAPAVSTSYTHDLTTGEAGGLLTLGAFASNHRASGGMVVDVDGVMRELPQDAAINTGARVVYNAIPELWYWNDDGVSIVKSGDDRVLTFDSTGKSLYSLAVSPRSDTYIENGVYALAVDLKGSGTVVLSCGRNIGGTDTPATATITLTGTYVRYAVIFTGIADNQGVKCAITSGTATECTAKDAQLEAISGATSQVPADFITNETAQNYATRNANTLSSNVVTSIADTVAIPAVRGVVAEGATYNMMPHFDMIEPDGWVEPASLTYQNGDGVLGTVGSSMTFALGSSKMSLRDFPKYGENLVTLSAWAKKNTLPEIEIHLNNAGGGISAWGRYNFDTLAATISTGTGIARIVEPPNARGWMRVSLSIMGGGGEPLRNQVDFGSNGGIAGDFFIDGLQLEQEDYASSNTCPNGYGFMREETNLTATFAAMGLAPALNNIQMSTTLVINTPAGELCGLGDKTNGLWVDLDGTTLSCTKYINGTPYIATGSVPAYDLGDSVDIVASVSGSGVSCTWDGGNEITAGNAANFADAVAVFTIGNSNNNCKTVGVSAI